VYNKFLKINNFFLLKREMDTEEEQDLEAFLRRMHERFPLDADALLDQAAGNLRDAERLGEELLERRSKEAQEIENNNHRELLTQRSSPQRILNTSYATEEGQSSIRMDTVTQSNARSDVSAGGDTTENVGFPLNSVDVGEDAAAGDDLGQNSFSPLQAIRGEIIAQAGGLLPRTYVQMNHKTSTSQRDYSAASPDETNLITVVYGLPNPEVACHAIAPTQLLAASATVLQRVEGMGYIRGNNSPLNLIIHGILSVTNPSVDSRKDGVQCLSDAHRMLSPDQAGRQDDAGDFLDKALFELGFKAPKLRKMYTCTSCSHDTIDDDDPHGFQSAVWHIQASDKSVEEGIRKALLFDVKKLCSECGKDTIHDVIIKVQKPQTLPVIAIVIDRVGAGGKVNLDRVTFPLTLRGVGFGGNRRLVGICSHLGESSRYGHYVATVRRFLHVERLEHDRSETISVPTGTFLRFDDGKVPRPVSLEDIADEEKTTLLLYEIAPDGYEIEENVPSDRPTLPEVCTFTPRHSKVDREASNEDIPSAKERNGGDVDLFETPPRFHTRPNKLKLENRDSLSAKASTAIVESSDWTNLRTVISSLKSHPYHIDVFNNNSISARTTNNSADLVCCNSAGSDALSVDNSDKLQCLKHDFADLCVEIASDILKKSSSMHDYNTRKSFPLYFEDDEALRKRAIQPEVLTDEQKLSASLVTLALDQQQFHIEATILLAKLELISGHAFTANERLNKLDVMRDDLLKLKEFSLRVFEELRDSLGGTKIRDVMIKPLTPSSPMIEVLHFGKLDPNKDMLISDLDPVKVELWTKSPKKEQARKVFSLFHPMILNHCKIVMDALAERTPHRAVIGSWNLRCSANYHNPSKTLPLKIHNVASLAKTENWSIIALQEAPKNSGDIEDMIKKERGETWRWVSNAVSESEVGGFAFDSSLWAVELLSNDYDSTKYKRAPVCAMFTSIKSPTTFIALASVHIKARDTTQLIDALEATRNEVEALGSENGVASFLVKSAEQKMSNSGPDALAYISIVGDFNLSWKTQDPTCTPIYPNSNERTAWQNLIDKNFRALVSEGQSTNAHEIMLSSSGHCFDNVLVRIITKNAESDISNAKVAPWPQDLQDLVDGLEAVVTAASNAPCSERLRNLAVKSIRTSVCNEMFEQTSDHRALTTVFETLIKEF
jgi:hypothetical protein